MLPPLDTGAAVQPDRGEAGPESLSGQILKILNSIIDPCSVASAIPAGLVDMGLIRHLSLQPLATGRWRCEIRLCVTHAFCMMTGIFVNEIERGLGGLSALSEVRVELDCSTIWTEEFMSQEYRLRLQERRAQRGIE